MRIIIVICCLLSNAVMGRLRGASATVRTQQAI